MLSIPSLKKYFYFFALDKITAGVIIESSFYPRFVLTDSGDLKKGRSLFLRERPFFSSKYSIIKQYFCLSIPFFAKIFFIFPLDNLKNAVIKDSGLFLWFCVL